MPRHWLMKSEPEVFSIDDLAREGKTAWDGVRNYQARNFMRDEMKLGDLVLYYHSNADPAGVAGIAKVCREAYPDPTQFDASSEYHDPKSDPDDPRWVLVDVEFVERFDEVVPLTALKDNPALADMKVVQRGMRLSVQPVTPDEWNEVLSMAQRPRRPGGKKRGKA
jgi:predicted RNA-binding protein with PUA-like domain